MNHTLLTRIKKFDRSHYSGRVLESIGGPRKGKIIINTKIIAPPPHARVPDYDESN